MGSEKRPLKEIIEENLALKRRLARLEKAEKKCKKAESALLESEERFRRLAENAPDIIYRMRIYPNPIFEYISGAVMDITGYSPHEFYEDAELGLNIIHPEDRPELEEFLKRLLEVEHHVVRWVSKDGRIIWTEDRHIPILDEKGNVIAIEGVARDITQRKLAQEALSESEEKFRNLAEESPNMIFINQRGVIVYANKKCEEFMGYRLEEFYSPDFNFLNLIAPEYQAKVKENLQIHMEGKDIPSEDYALITKDGKRIEAIHTTKLIKYEGGQAILGIITDITKRKRAEENLKSAYEELRSLERLKTDIISNVSHELKTPLSIIMGNVELATEEDELSEIRELLDIALQASRRQEETINDLVAIGLMNIDEPVKSEENIEVLLKKIITNMSKMAEGRGIDIELNLAENIPSVRIDQIKIDQVIKNIINNAIKFNSKNGSIKINVRVADNSLKISISDNGIGIKEENLDKIFEPLTQLDPSSKRKFGGTGTGLAVAKRYVKAHKGQIWAESEYGKGTTFHITLPIE